MITRYLQIPSYHTIFHSLIWAYSSSLRTTGANLYFWGKAVLKLIDEMFLISLKSIQAYIVNLHMYKNLQSLVQSTIIIVGMNYKLFFVFF
jgi:hypothetical protein